MVSSAMVLGGHAPEILALLVLLAVVLLLGGASAGSVSRKHPAGGKVAPSNRGRSSWSRPSAHGVDAALRDREIVAEVGGMLR